MLDTLTLNDFAHLNKSHLLGSQNIIEVLLNSKRSEHTRKAYYNDLKDFFAEIYPG